MYTNNTIEFTVMLCSFGIGMVAGGVITLLVQALTTRKYDE